MRSCAKACVGNVSQVGWQLDAAIPSASATEAKKEKRIIESILPRKNTRTRRLLLAPGELLRASELDYASGAPFVPFLSNLKGYSQYTGAATILFYQRRSFGVWPTSGGP